MTDPREQAARYRARQEAGSAASDDPQAEAPSTGIAAGVDRAAYVESAIQVAIRRGDFDDLPGAGKPIAGLGDHHDPDWWIRRKIQTENLTGLGPPALLLREENRTLDERLDQLTRESDVRDALDDFNRRVVEARRQLQGGPPVVTPPRDVDTEVTAWAERRARRSAPVPPASPGAEQPRRFRLRRRGSR